jgi:hypothetical protein
MFGPHFSDFDLGDGLDEIVDLDELLKLNETIFSLEWSVQLHILCKDIFHPLFKLFLLLSLGERWVDNSSTLWPLIGVQGLSELHGILNFAMFLSFLA